MILNKRKILPNSIFFITYRDSTNFCNSDELFILTKIHYRILSINANTANNIRLDSSESSYHMIMSVLDF